MFSTQRTSFSSVVVPLVLATLVVVIICSALYQREANQVADASLERESRRMEIFSGLFQKDFAAAVSDLRLSASGDGLQAYLLTGSPADLQRAVSRATFFSKDNPDYDQIRYIDENGMERLRLNWNGEVVPTNQLQNKADRSYFQKTNVLSEREIYISNIDLNEEHGVVEQPINPTVRLAMPVFDGTGKRRGIYVINYRIENAIERVRHFVLPKYQQRFRLLNSDGYWLAAAKPDQEWGFQLPDRKGMTLAQTDPALWAKIAANPTGQEPYRGGYFTWYRTVPATYANDKPVTLVTGDKFLVMASELTRAEWLEQFTSLRQTFVIVALILMILALIITWYFQKHRRAQLERDRFFALTRDMLCVAGFDGYFARLNPAWRNALGYTEDELMARPFIDFVHPEDKEKTLAATATLLKGGEVVSFENRYRCKDGSYRWLSWSARPLVGVQLIYASARDLTDRKRFEEQLRQGELRSRSIIESAHDAFISTDEEGRIKDWNLKAEVMFGWSRAEVLGHFLHETIIPAKYRDAHVRGIKHLKATGEGPVLNQMLELSALRKSGAEFPVEFVIWPLQLGDETTFHAFIRDITRRKEAEANIQNLNGELKQRATLLESANKELESFSYSVSHDLRAPLRHIHGFVEILQKSPGLEGDEQAHRQMSVISRAAQEMGRLIDDLLAFSRTGRAEMNPVPVDMRPIIDQIITDRAHEIKDRKVTWDIQPLEKVSGDPSLLRLVWTNLIDNALKYSRKADVARIEIGQAPADQEALATHQVIFFVRDNGVGFDMQYASKLFGVFQRLHRAEDFEGTGIGLANVQRIIHRHGGRIWAESRLDAGATFFFSLPLVGNNVKKA